MIPNEAHGYCSVNSCLPLFTDDQGNVTWTNTDEIDEKIAKTDQTLLQLLFIENIERTVWWWASGRCVCFPEHGFVRSCPEEHDRGPEGRCCWSHHAGVSLFTTSEHFWVGCRRKGAALHALFLKSTATDQNNKHDYGSNNWRIIWVCVIIILKR